MCNVSTSEMGHFRCQSYQFVAYFEKPYKSSSEGQQAMLSFQSCACSNALKVLDHRESTKDIASWIQIDLGALQVKWMSVKRCGR